MISKEETENLIKEISRFTEILSKATLLENIRANVSWNSPLVYQLLQAIELDRRVSQLLEYCYEGDEKKRVLGHFRNLDNLLIKKFAWIHDVERKIKAYHLQLERDRV